MLAPQGHVEVAGGPTVAEASVNHLAAIIFVENPQGKPVYFSVPGLSGPESLFLFCVDLLMRGILLTYSPPGAPPWDRPPPGSLPVPIHEVSDEHFASVARKLECAGIFVAKRSTPCGESGSPSVRLNRTVAPQEGGAAPAERLEAYSLTVGCRGVKHDVTFRIGIPPLGAAACRVSGGRP